MAYSEELAERMRTNLKSSRGAKKLLMLRNYLWLFIVGCLALVSCAPSVATQKPATPTLSPNATPLTNTPPSTCPITRPPDVPFAPPAPYPARPPDRYAGQFWYGSPELWTMLGTDGTWSALPRGADGYSQKVFWWREGYSADAEATPALTVSGERLDAATPPFEAKGATNASADFGQAMLIGINIPTDGCWKITGHYHGHDLSFVVWVAP